jgi:hypothetical protein
MALAVHHVLVQAGRGQLALERARQTLHCFQ